MRTIFAEYNPQRNSIDVYTSAGYMLRIDCWEAEKNLKTTPGSDCTLNALAIDEPLEYAKLYLDGTMQLWVDAEDSLERYAIFFGFREKLCIIVQVVAQVQHIYNFLFIRPSNA